MGRAKVIIAASKDMAASLKKQLSSPAFEILDYAVSGNEVLRKVTALQPDAVITDYSLTDMTGIDLARTVEHLHICPVIILASQTQSEYVEELKGNSLDIFCITKPVNGHVLNHTLSLVIRLSKRVHEYEHKVDELKHQIEDRKIIERAKGILMKKFNMSEEEAYNEMRRKAMNSSKPLAQIAKTIIDMFELMNG